MAFDPYHIWLGIPREEQPADHYRLLSLARFESDLDVIESAADRQMAHVRTFQAGSHSADSQRILNELSAAKLCLLDPQKRAAYEAELRRRLEAAKPVERTLPVAQPLPAAPVRAAEAISAQTEAPPLFVTDRGHTPHSAVKRRPKSNGPLTAWAALGVTVIVAAVIVGAAVKMNKPKSASTRPRREELSGETTVKPKPPVPPIPRPVGPGDTVGAKPGRFPFEIPDPRRARWSLEGDELVQSSLDANGNVSMVFGDPSWQDLDFSVDVKRTEGANSCAMLFGHQDGWNTNYFALAGSGGKVHSVEAVEDGKFRRLDSRDGPLTTGKWHRVTLRLRGNTGQCFLDDEQILSFNNTERPSKGRIGLCTWDSAYRFRNIEVKTPDGKVLLTGLPDLDSEPPEKPYEAEEKKVLAARGGTLPKAADGRALNFDFETGDLQDWTAEGEAFKGGPIKGDTLHERYKYLRSQHAGQFWIGGYDKTADAAKGTLTSVAFKVTHPYASFLMAGGGVWTGTAVELVRRENNNVLLRAVGSVSDSLQLVLADLSQHLDQEIYIRVMDGSDGHWGRVSFDDFRFHDTMPDLQPRFAESTGLEAGTAADVLKLLDIERDSRSGVWHWDERWRLVANWGWRMIRLPVAAPNEYDLALTVEGNPHAAELWVVLPVGGRQVLAIIDGWGRTTSGLALIDSKNADSNESTHHGRVLLDGQPNKVVCQVRSRSVKIACNGATVMEWQGDPARLSLLWGNYVAGYGGLAVGGAWESWRLSQIELTPISLPDAHRNIARGGPGPLKDPSAELAKIKTGGSDAKNFPRGRYVRIELPRKGTLTLAEVEVYRGGQNIARSGRATQKNVTSGGEAARGIDGNKSGVYGVGGQTHTEDDTPDPWWELDLGEMHPLESILIYNRTDCCGDRLEGFTLRVLDAARHTVVERTAIRAPEPSVAFELRNGKDGIATLEQTSNPTNQGAVMSATAVAAPSNAAPSDAMRSAAPQPERRSFADLAKKQNVTDPASSSAKLTAALAFTLPQQHTSAVTRVAFHPTLPLLASAGKDGRVLLWNLEKQVLLAQFEKFNQEAWTVKFSPDGNLLTYANRHWWGSVVPSKNVATNVEFARLKGFKNGGGAVGAVAYSPDGAFFASGQDDGTIRLWETATFQEMLPASAGGRVNSLAFGLVAYDRKRKPSKYVLAAACHEGSVKTFNLAYLKDKNGERWTFEPSTVAFPKQEPALCARFSPNGQVLACARARGTISFFNPATGQPMHNDIRASNANAEWVAFHPQKPWVVAAHWQDHLARIWNYQSGELLCDLPGHTSGVFCAEFSRDGRHVATASDDFSIKFWNLAGAELPPAPKKGKKAKLPVPIVGD